MKYQFVHLNVVTVCLNELESVYLKVRIFKCSYRNIVLGKAHVKTVIFHGKTVIFGGFSTPRWGSPKKEAWQLTVARDPRRREALAFALGRAEAVQEAERGAVISTEIISLGKL